VRKDNQNTKSKESKNRVDFLIKHKESKASWEVQDFFLEGIRMNFIISNWKSNESHSLILTK
jgi:hypothetical protein